MAEDGHTVLKPPKRLGRKIYPVDFYLFSDGLYVKQATSKYTDLFGKRVMQINGVPVQALLDSLSPYISGGNKMLTISRATEYLHFPPLYYGIGLFDSLWAPLNLTLKYESGETKTVNIKPVSYRSLPKMIDAAQYKNSQKKLPLYRRLKSNYAFEYLPEENLLYFRFRSVLNEEDGPFAEFVHRMFDFVESHKVEKFVVDIRNNGDGNNYLVQPLLHALIGHKKIDKPGHLFVIINRNTFSAAMDLAARLDLHT